MRLFITCDCGTIDARRMMLFGSGEGGGETRSRLPTGLIPNAFHSHIKCFLILMICPTHRALGCREWRISFLQGVDPVFNQVLCFHLKWLRLFSAPGELWTFVKLRHCPGPQIQLCICKQGRVTHVDTHTNRQKKTIDKKASKLTAAKEGTREKGRVGGRHEKVICCSWDKIMQGSKQLTWLGQNRVVFFKSFHYPENPKRRKTT